MTEFYAFGIVGSLATTRRALGSGTEGSNPACSSGESANHRFRRRFQGLDVNTERVVAFGHALRSRRVVMTPRRRLTPTIPAARISRAIRFLPTARPSARNSAWTRGAP